ncbi:DNA excision repair protein ERCC-6-like 2, partial [Rhizoclosmatium hyalinum]
MGLGKTIQVIAFLSAVTHKTGIPDEKNTRKLMHRNGRLQQMKASEIFRALIVCPTSVIYNWERELDTWGYFSTGIFHGTMRKETLAKAVVGLLEVTITSFGTARNYQHELDTVSWSCIIVDEVHQLK